jgi:hypothetical protein
MERFLQGMHAMDAHFRSAPLPQNLPVLLGLLNVRAAPPLRLVLCSCLGCPSAVTPGQPGMLLSLR